MIQRILAIHSIRDRGAEKRIAAASYAPGLVGKDLRHICIIDQERAPKAVRMLERSNRWELQTPEERKMSSDELYDRAMHEIIVNDFVPALRAEIEQQDTELCVFHSGGVFSGHVGRVLMGIRDIGADYPNVQWALESQIRWLDRQTSKARKAERSFERMMIRGNRDEIARRFTTGPEVNDILKATFG